MSDPATPPHLPEPVERALVQALDRGVDALARRARELAAAHAGDAEAIWEWVAIARAESLDGRSYVGRAADPREDSESVLPTATDVLMRSLEAAPRFEDERYFVEGDVGRGGMGSILRLHDKRLNRRVAMKVLLPRAVPRSKEEQQLAYQLLARFLEEAQVTSQLDHPGVVPVHELGMDANGKVFFTMRLVNGRTAREVFADARAGRNDWTLTRALEVLLKVCDTIAFAHDKGVLHRDLKPANVMVGRFGEVYVMDWGLAKLLSRPARIDLKIRPSTSPDPVESARQHDSGNSSSGVVSMDGQRLGSPSYMSPEQARSEELDQRADVYSIGAMLYELLTGSAPYTFENRPRPGYEVLQAVVDGPPSRVEELAPTVPAELNAIVEKAMAREQRNRYPDAIALAADLRAFLDHRAVSAYRTGAFFELRLWVRRNRPLAASLIACILLVSVGAVGMAVLAGAARARTAEFDRLSQVVRLENALATERVLYPAWPDRIEVMQAWLEDYAGPLLSSRSEVGMAIAELRQRGAWRPESDPAHEGRGAWAFPDEADAFLHRTLVDVAAGIDAFARETAADVRRRIEWAERLESLTYAHPNASTTWAAARDAIARADGVKASARYGDLSGFALDPQLGLVPIGMNPVTKLWEFYHLRSAWDPGGVVDPEALPIPSAADYDAEGRLPVTAESGVVFVLLPSATFWMGSSADHKHAQHDPLRDADETLRPETLGPFFLARHELTRAQFSRLTGAADPSFLALGGSEYVNFGDPPIGVTHPVEGLTWFDSQTLAKRHGLALPTEAQWEYACRAGQSTPWWSGRAARLLAGVANVLDSRAHRAVPRWGLPTGDFDDGWVGPAPVGSFRPNPFGLFDMHGNVFEWCVDRYDAEGEHRVTRGGCFNDPAELARSSYRRKDAPDYRVVDLGVRLARALR